MRCFKNTWVVEKYLEEEGTLFAVFIGFEKVYDEVDRRGLWDVLRI